MLHSMTGFAAVSIENTPQAIRLELKSVNHRYLDIQCRLPEEFRHLENDIRNAVSASIVRGKVECRVFIEKSISRDNVTEVDWKLVDDLANLSKTMRDRHPDITPLSVADILQYPGITNNHHVCDNDTLRTAVLGLLQQALKQFKEDRAREGRHLQTHLLQRLEKMSGLITQLEQLFPHLLTAYYQKSEQRLRNAIGAAVDDDRLKQEFALFMQKADVDEECSRLRTHIEEVRRIITQDAAQGVGKRLDFLMQELNREANTLGSKSIAAECTQTSVELKVLIEQMREQIQNIE